MSCVAIPLSALPPGYYHAAATACKADFDQLAQAFATQPERHHHKEGPGEFRVFAIRCSSGRHATIVQWKKFAPAFEVNLQLVQASIFYESDLLEILALAGMRKSDIVWTTGGFKWKKSRVKEVHRNGESP